MLNIRTLILAVVLAVLLMAAVPFVTARTEVVSHRSRGPASVLQEAYANQIIAPVVSYRSRLDVCFDVPLSEVSACRAEGQTLIPSYRSRLDECFDVSISELASCRNTNQASTP